MDSCSSIYEIHLLIYKYIWSFDLKLLNYLVKESIWFDVVQHAVVKKVTIKVMIDHIEIYTEVMMDEKRFSTPKHGRRYLL